MLDLSKLNHNQLAAVQAGMGPMLIVAGAGTGKTRVLTTRIAYLIEQKKIDPHRILAITFTNKAANEMRVRINKMVEHTHIQWIGTYHAVCLKILKQDINSLDRQNNFNVIDDEDQLTIIREIFKEGNISVKDIKPKKALEIIQRVKLDEIDLATVNSIQKLRDLKIFRWEDLSSFRYIVKNYERKLLKSNLLDFDDLLILTRRLFNKHPDVKAKWQSKFDYILVDEFQDTNYIQFEIFNSLINPTLQNIFVVGDPDQTIYTWRGAYSDIFNDFLENFKNTKIFILDLNYRSTKNILKTANNLIKNNDNRIDKKLTTNNHEGDKAIVYTGDTTQQEASYIGKQIQDLIKNKNYKYSDIAILYRAKHLSRAIEQEFIVDAIPYYVYGDIRFYQRREIKDLIAYLKLIVKPNDELSLKRIINIPSRGIGQTTIERIGQYAIEHNLSFYDVILQIANNEIETQWTKPSIKQFVLLMENIVKETTHLSIGDVLQSVIKIIKYDDYLKTLDQYEERSQNVKELIVSMEEYQFKHPNNSLSDFLDEISLYTEVDDYKNKSHNSVSLMTIHFAKGTEFKVVFIIGMNENIFPSRHLNCETDMEEERRIAYVAITRSMEKLYLTCNLGFSPISSEKLTPSRFIKEIGKDSYQSETSEMVSISKADLNWYDSRSFFNPQDNYDTTNITFKVGDVVVHTVFGSGLIIGINGDMIDVAFKAPYGIKSLIKNHKSIKRMKN